MRKLILVAVVLLAGCSSASDAERALAAAGYTQVVTTGFRFFGCSEDDQFRTGFEAVGPSGNRVTGAVCSGWLKGATIRTD